MGGVKVDIIWSPNHEDHFVTFGTDLSLYKVDVIKDGNVKQQAIKLSEDTVASLLSVNSDHQFVKCLAWYPKPNPDHLLAVGLANGKVSLTSFGKGGTTDPHGLIGKEFVPKHARQCNHLSWNPMESNLLAEGLDKYRADYSVLIWDVHSKGPGEVVDRKLSTVSHDSLVKPYVELGASETTLSLAWFSREPKTLVTGMNHKFLRIYDLKDISRPMNVAYTKAVYGVCVDPFFDHRLASYVEGQVSIWDTRNFEKPVLTLQDSKQIMKVAWSPTRSGLLGVLPKDSPVVKLYDIQNTTVGSDELEPAVIDRFIQPYKQHPVSSFDWHWTQENRMLTVTPTGTIKDNKVFERIAHDWSPDIFLTIACGRQMQSCHSVKLSREVSEDISMKMKRRALKGYGLQTENLKKNGYFVDDPHIRQLWSWLEYVQSIQPAEEQRERRPSGRTGLRYIGVKSVLLGDQSGSPPVSQTDFLQWQGIDGPKNSSKKKIYRSDERTRALQLCQWGTQQGDNYTLREAITRLESEGEFERAAAIAVFNLQMRRGIEALQRGAATKKVQAGDLNLNVVAMALSGYTDERNTLWHQMVGSQSTMLLHPYLRTMFAFLTADPDRYEDMLMQSEMEVIDQVAFACMYLSDYKLTEFIKKMTSKLIENGQLNGILLTGLSIGGIDLLESYVDHTADVQTASLVALQGFPCLEVSKDTRVHTWIENYRTLLDTWRLWHQRAEFDVYRSSCDNSQHFNKQVFVTCNFCGKSIAYNMLASRNRHFMFGGTTAHKPKITGCPGCRKPLPRCALCLINMGTAAGSTKYKPPKDYPPDDESSKLTQFSDWFTWCQTCRHGGHANHMMEWFREHTQCPVTGCTCQCSKLDSMGRIPTDEEKQLSPVPSH